MPPKAPPMSIDEAVAYAFETFSDHAEPEPSGLP
jgi:hypothetical protein